jgi:hypothetical protein
MAELVGPTKRSDIPYRDGVRRSLERASGLEYRAEGFGVRDEPSAPRFQFALGGDGIGPPGQDEGNDFGDIAHGSLRGFGGSLAAIVSVSCCVFESLGSLHPRRRPRLLGLPGVVA